MFKAQNKIIIVDNLEKELDVLSEAFLDNGIGCKPILYDTSYDKSPLTNVRIAFFDINITEKTVNETGGKDSKGRSLNAGIFNDLAYAIEQCISIENGPYALIFWTKNDAIINEFIAYIQNEKRGYSNLPKPIFISYIDKDQFSGHKECLPEKLIEVLNKEEIRFLFEFENEIRESGAEVINMLYDLIPKDEKWGENTVFLENLDKTFSKIAASTLGFDFAQERPRQAIYEGLLPLLNNKILTSDNHTNWESLLKELFKAEKYSDLKFPEEVKQSMVNSIFHINFNTKEKGDRGVVIELDKDSKPILDSLNIVNVKAWFNKLLPFADDKIKREVRRESKLIAIEFSAACDFSQKKERINKYILGFITPNFDFDSEIDKDRMMDSSYCLGGCDFYNGILEKDFQIWVNLNFVFGCKEDDKRLNTPVFTLKKGIMDMLGNKYASHVSRIGITTF